MRKCKSKLTVKKSDAHQTLTTKDESSSSTTQTGHKPLTLNPKSLKTLKEKKPDVYKRITKDVGASGDSKIRTKPRESVEVNSKLIAVESKSQTDKKGKPKLETTAVQHGFALINKNEFSAIIPTVSNTFDNHRPNTNERSNDTAQSEMATGISDSSRARSTLLNKKKAQWAKEKEELQEIWNPWYQRSHSVSSKMRKSASSRESIATVNSFDNQREYHFPPIRRTRQSASERAGDKFHPFSNNGSSVVQKPSLPLCINTVTGEVHFAGNDSVNKGDGEEGTEIVRLTHLLNLGSPYNIAKSKSGDSVIHGNNNSSKRIASFSDDTGTSGYHSSEANFCTPDLGRRISGGNNGRKDPQVIIHNIQREGEYNEPNPPKIPESRANVHFQEETMRESDMHFTAEERNKVGQLPPTAIRSSIAIGGNEAIVESYKNLQNEEKQRWLADLEIQREEQRLKRQLEKEDKRPKWGDKGVGVGHFWNPDETVDGLPPRGKTSTIDNLSVSTGQLHEESQYAPAWLEKRLQPGNQSISQPDLPQHYGSNSSSGRLDSVYQISPRNEERNYARGKNVPIDPDLMAEKEHKRKLALQHQEALRKQMEERQQRLNAEREARIKEEKAEEVRILRQRQLELQRLERERRDKGGSGDHLENCRTPIDDDAFITPCHAQAHRNKQAAMLDANQPTFPSHHIVSESTSETNDHSESKNSDVELARRQSITLLSQEECENMNTAKSTQDVALTTETDHEYQCELTPTKMRSRSLSTNRECGTQTESNVTNGRTEKGKERASTKNKSKPEEKKADKPKWGMGNNSHTTKEKKYLKQSEKDPWHQQKLKKRLDRERRERQVLQTQLVAESGTESEITLKSTPDLPRKSPRKPKTVKESSSNNKIAPSSRQSMDTTESNLSNVNINTKNPVVKPSRTAVNEEKTKPWSKSKSVESIRVKGSDQKTCEEHVKDGVSIPKHPAKCRSRSTHRKTNKTSTAVKKPPTVTPEKTEEIQSVIYYQATEAERPPSPPVPALLKKMQMGFVPDENGRLTSLSSRIPVSPVITPTPEPESQPVEVINTQSTRYSEANTESRQVEIEPEGYFYNYDEENDTTSAPSACLSRTSSAGKVDIEIALTKQPTGRSGTHYHESYHNIVRQRIAEECENPMMDETTKNFIEYVDDNDNRNHDDWSFRGRLEEQSARRPRTKDSEISGQESIIYDIMQDETLKEELSARENELSEKGIIEFNVRLPSRSGKSAFLGQQYSDPYIAQRQKSYASWLNKDTKRDSVLSHLSYLKKGVMLQQQEWGFMPSEEERD